MNAPLAWTVVAWLRVFLLTVLILGSLAVDVGAVRIPNLPAGVTWHDYAHLR
jgi:hypothetical protein